MSTRYIVWTIYRCITSGSERPCGLHHCTAASAALRREAFPKFCDTPDARSQPASARPQFFGARLFFHFAAALRLPACPTLRAPHTELFTFPPLSDLRCSFCGTVRLCELPSSAGPCGSLRHYQRNGGRDVISRQLADGVDVAAQCRRRELHQLLDHPNCTPDYDEPFVN